MAISVRSGKQHLILKKSSHLVGLRSNKSAEEVNYITKELHKNLGGFHIVQLAKSVVENIDTKLDEVRAFEEVDTGTHVYYAEGSNRPIVPTGDIFIQFQAGSSADEQHLVLQEFALTLSLRKDETNIIATVTPNSPNPLKVAHALENISLVKWAEPDLDAPMDEYNVELPRMI
ncbi:MAG: hypothetical protein HC912_02530 [Saprospiraceae bacterium]|nr:hypothetical protein [Saprospiraceae bacterium]